MNLAPKFFQEVIEQVPIGIMFLRAGDVVYANGAALAMFGYDSISQILKQKFFDALLPTLSQNLQRCSSQQQSQYYDEVTGYTRQGTTIDVEVNVLYREVSNDVDTIITVRDVTKRKIAERDRDLWIKEQEALSLIDRTLIGEMDLEKILDVITQQVLSLLHCDWTAIVVCDVGAGIAQWKTVKGNRVKYSKDKFVINDLWQSLLWTKDILLCDAAHTSAVCALQSIPELVQEGIVSLVIVPLRVEDVPKGCLFVGFREDHDFSGREVRQLITMAEKNALAILNAQLYSDLMQREKELEKLSGVRIQAQEEERRKIAREIHDGLGQLLTAIKFNLEILEDTIEKTPEQQERINDMKSLLDNVMVAARELSYNLMPSILDDFGVIPALQVFCDQVSQRTGNRILFQAHGVTGRFNLDWEIGLYRIVQESLQLFQKCGIDGDVDIQLFNSSNGLRLIIEGLARYNKNNAPIPIEHDSIDVVSIRERASLIGGTVSIDWQGSAGITLCIDVPYSGGDVQSI